ncbi:hypothetical protein [Aeromonas rivipollensis]|uniref:hypothetical protein n=1 Tax=Aeromonas rivipollensis TaxID=948519 RepID=UPI001F1ECFA5|nr:hypothetical protein [Aeromonas rivipollensis]MCE9955771.1 hypothetical protein [Aeromonas rivipollensis]
MDIKQRALWLANKLIGVLWFIVRNPFLIIKRLIRWSLIAVFWLFLLGWGISAFAVESAPAKYVNTVLESDVASNCYIVGLVQYQTFNVTSSQCLSSYNAAIPSYKGITLTSSFVYDSTNSTYIFYKATGRRGVDGGSLTIFMGMPKTFVGARYICPPDGKAEYTIGPVDLNGTKVCQKQPITCKMGEIKAVSGTTGVETCKENCGSVAGQGLADAAYNQAFLPSATVTCYGSCSVISQGTTVTLPNAGFTSYGDIQFTGDKCPVTFPEEGDGQPVYNDQPESSDETTAAQDQLQNASSGATSNTVSGATGTADLNQVVDKLAETSNAQIKAMSEQNAALGKVIEGVGKDIQGAIKQSGGGGGSGASMGQLATANAIKEGNATLQEISDKLDEQQDPEPPVKPGTDLEADATAIHEANDWGQRNFGTVLTANAERFKALPVFSLPSTFFNANIAGGSCPSYTGSFTLFGTSFDFSFDAFCSQAVMNVMPYIRAVVMMLFGWLAWRIAIGNGG